MVSKEEILSRITPKNDLVFKKIFGAKGNEGILKSLLESILEIKFDSLTVIWVTNCCLIFMVASFQD